MSTSDWLAQLSRLNYFAGQLAERGNAPHAYSRLQAWANELEQVTANSDAAIAHAQTPVWADLGAPPQQPYATASSALSTPHLAYALLPQQTWVSPTAQTAPGPGEPIQQPTASGPLPPQVRPRNPVRQPKRAPGVAFAAPYSLAEPPPDPYLEDNARKRRRPFATTLSTAMRRTASQPAPRTMGWAPPSPKEPC